MGGRTAIRSAQVAESGRTAAGSGYTTAGNAGVLTTAGSGFGHAERMYHTLGVPHLLGADVPPLGGTLITQSGRTAIGDCQYVSRVLGAVMPLGQYSSLDMNIVTGRVSIKLK